MGMMKEFKEFAMKGNLVDMAIAFVMGGAFGKVTTSFIEGVIMPIVGKLTGGVDFSKMQLKIKVAEIDAAGKETAAAVFIKYGAFITTLVDFIVVAFVMFMVIKAINKMKKKEEAAPVAAPAAPTATEVLLTEIRDALKK
jgi:large conductance mechanosensitive channel